MGRFRAIRDMDVSWWVAWNGEGKQQSQHTDGFGVGEKVCRHVRGETAWLRAVGEVTRCSRTEFNVQLG